MNAVLPGMIVAPAAPPPGSDRWVLAGDPPTVTGSNFRELVTQNHDREIFVSEDSMIRVDYLSGKEIFGTLTRI